MKPLKHFLFLFFILFLSLSAMCQSEKKGNYFVNMDSKTQQKLDSLIKIGNSYYMLGQLNISIEYYDKAIKINTKFAKAFFNRGNSNFDLGLTKQACDDWFKAKELGQEEAGELIVKNCK